ncbi:hypothetical protein GOP47_0015976 [Adiantum capillus-veneris]|uniref:Uncharacterized protein n=1 Tax=Adiantum capillus-veneris TaxID=13818 RepID=A0A9D4UKQ0_ADICA|nr:hypothetical protein GOP47_0015976 [Adiantum capillus-veneris]
MPGLHALRSVSSTSSSSSASSTHARAAASQRPATVPSAPTPVPVTARALPAFHSALANRAAPSLTAQPICFKHITDPLTNAAQNPRLQPTSTTTNYSSSGSPHDDPSTVCLAAMVHEFLEEEMSAASCGRIRCNCVDAVCSGDDEETFPMHDELKHAQLPDDHLCEILEGVTSCSSNPELLLLVDVARAVEAESEELTSVAMAMDGDGGGLDDDDDDDDGALTHRLRRSVMKRLRQEGYNAAICKSRWKHADGLPAGDYEYIDIVTDGKGALKKQERVIVDIDFRAQFEIARASKQYVQLLGVLPRLFVGRPERLKQILKIMSNAAKCSLKQQGLLLPPWRKHKYMQAKWFSPYRRTTNIDSFSSFLQSPHHVLGLGLKAPKILSLDFTKEMDLLYYKVQVKALNNYSQHHAQKRGLSNTAAGNMDNINVRTGFASNPQSLEACTHARCTDWQLPSLDEKCKAGTNSRERVSGISTALKQATASLSKQLTSPQLAMVS